MLSLHRRGLLDGSLFLLRLCSLLTSLFCCELLLLPLVRGLGVKPEVELSNVAAGTMDDSMDWTARVQLSGSNSSQPSCRLTCTVLRSTTFGMARRKTVTRMTSPCGVNERQYDTSLFHLRVQFSPTGCATPSTFTTSLFLVFTQISF